MAKYLASLSVFLFVFLACTPLHADGGATFDLIGPKVEIKVARAGKELPIAQVPNLAPGDRLWVHADFPASQSEHYLLIVCFLRGTTNPPPDDWFTRADFWNKRVAEEGLTINVPVGAQQVVLFLAPSTGGDFSTLRNAVKGRPGAFIRAVQDLNAASYDRLRYQTFIAAIQNIPSSDTKELKKRTNLLARSLNIKINQDCFLRSSGQQIICLTAGENAVVMDDGHSSLIAQFTSGPTSDLLANASATQMAGGGYYSAYVGAVVDVVRIMSGLHTAKYQYIPALALPADDELNLKLNNPPSFHNPKSVLVIALPAVQGAQMPPLHAVNPSQLFCLPKPGLVLPVEGAPLLFATAFAHHLMLRIDGSTPIELPVTTDAARGGFTIDDASLKQLTGADTVHGTIEGAWGFDSYTGPTFLLQPAAASHWTVDSGNENGLVVGRDERFTLKSSGTACVDSIHAVASDGKFIPATWTPGDSAKPNLLRVNLSLKDAQPGELALQVKQFGQSDTDTVKLNTYTDPPTPQKLTLHAGDTTATLTGKGLEQVAAVQAGGTHFTLGDVTGEDTAETLVLTIPDGQSAANLKPGSKQTAHIRLKDGRSVDFAFIVQPPRPRATLGNKSVQRPDNSDNVSLLLGSSDDLPVNAKLTFFVKSETPADFARDESLEVATPDGSLHTTLSLSNGTLILEDAHTVMATLDPVKEFGSSAFGDLLFRVLAADGSAGDWQPLAHLVRVPTLKEVRCPAQPDAACSLLGTDLYLIDSISAGPKFAASDSVSVPPDFTGYTLHVPRPSGTLLYLKLRDNPNSIDTAALPVLPDPLQ